MEGLELVRSEEQRHMPTEAEALSGNGGVYEEAGSIGYGSGEKIIGQEFSPCSENTTCSVCKACMRIRRKEKR